MSTYTLEGIVKKLTEIQTKAAQLLADNGRPYMEIALLDLVNNSITALEEIKKVRDGEAPPLTAEDLKTSGEIVGQIDFQLFVLSQAIEMDTTTTNWRCN